MEKSKKLKLNIAVIINLIVFGIAVYCFISLLNSFHKGANKFIYYTNISNLIVGAVSFANLIFISISLCKDRLIMPKAFSIIKFVALSMTSLTFVTVLFLIGPLTGFDESYSGRNFFTHLVIPILALCSYLFLEENIKFKWRASLFVLIPHTIYSTVYLLNILVFGTWPDLYMLNTGGLWYLFMLMFFAMDFGVAQGIYFLKKFIDKKQPN